MSDRDVPPQRVREKLSRASLIQKRFDGKTVSVKFHFSEFSKGELTGIARVEENVFIVDEVGKEDTPQGNGSFSAPFEDDKFQMLFSATYFTIADRDQLQNFFSVEIVKD